MSDPDPGSKTIAAVLKSGRGDKVLFGRSTIFNLEAGTVSEPSSL